MLFALGNGIGVASYCGLITYMASTASPPPEKVPFVDCTPV